MYLRIDTKSDNGYSVHPGQIMGGLSSIKGRQRSRVATVNRSVHIRPSLLQPPAELPRPPQIPIPSSVANRRWKSVLDPDLDTSVLLPAFRGVVRSNWEFGTETAHRRGLDAPLDELIFNNLGSA